MSGSEQLAADDPRHGTTNAYDNWKCRCDACREANRRKQREYMARSPEQREKKRQSRNLRYWLTGR